MRHSLIHCYVVSLEPSSVAVEVDHHMREQLESRVQELRGEKQQLQAQVLKLTELLSQAPKVTHMIRYHWIHLASELAQKP